MSSTICSEKIHHPPCSLESRNQGTRETCCSPVWMEPLFISVLPLEIREDGVYLSQKQLPFSCISDMANSASSWNTDFEAIGQMNVCMQQRELEKVQIAACHHNAFFWCAQLLVYFKKKKTTTLISYFSHFLTTRKGIILKFVHYLTIPSNPT